MLRFYSDNKDFSALFNEFIPCLYHLLFSAFTALYVVLLSIALLCFMAGLSTDKQHKDDIPMGLLSRQQHYFAN